MAERPTYQDSGHSPNPDSVLLELYRLLSIFLSSRGFAELRTGIGERWEPIEAIQSCEDDEITRLLLTVAITFRIIDNRKRDYIPPSRSCGILVKNLSNPTSTDPLTVREACNKILHAHVIRGDLDDTSDGQVYLNPIMYLYGPPEDVQWKATLNIIDFAKEYVSLVSFRLHK
jgi:hypothetical protein